MSGNQIIGYYSGSAIDTSGTVFLNNSTISGNTGAEALETFVGHIIVNNSTVVGNSGGIDNYQGTVSLSNSILSGNPTTGTPANCTGSTVCRLQPDRHQEFRMYVHSRDW